eukprot:scaffold113447_cov37-Prasinocladus_malaysianus.AAC.2
MRDFTFYTWPVMHDQARLLVTRMVAQRATHCKAPGHKAGIAAAGARWSPHRAVVRGPVPAAVELLQPVKCQ